MCRIRSVCVGIALATAVRGADAWQPASWGGGDVFLSIASHPSDDRVLWALAWLGGVLTSADQGETWQWANGDLAALDGVAIVPDPADVKGAYFVGATGLWRTDDVGARWRLVPGTETFRFTRATGSRPLLTLEDGGRLFVGTAAGEIFTCAGQGKAWQPIQWANSRPVCALREVPSRGIVLITLVDAAGVYAFRPGVWQTPRPVRGAPPFPVKDVLADRGAPYKLFGVCGPHGLWTAEATGDDWQEIEIEGVDAGEELLCVAQTGRGKERVLFACGKNVLLKSLNGKHWTVLRDNRHYDERANPTRQWFSRPSVPTVLEGGISPDNLFLADYWSLHRSLNATGDARFAETVRGAGTHVVNDLALDSRGVLFVAGDSSGVLATADGGASFIAVWPTRYGPDVGKYAALAIGGDDGLIVAGVDQWKGEVCFYHGNARERRIAGRAEGVTAERAVLRNGGAPVGPWKIAWAPADARRAYALIAGARPALFMSINNGETWKARGLPRDAQLWRALAADLERPDRLYVGTRGTNAGVWQSSDAGSTWERILAVNERVAALTALPGGVLCVLTERGTFHRSATRGATWSAPVATGLAMASALCVDAGAPSRMVAAGGNAVRISTDNGATWAALPGPPMTLPEIMCVCIDGRTQTLFVGTRGAGLWKVGLVPSTNE